MTGLAAPRLDERLKQGLDREVAVLPAIAGFGKADVSTTNDEEAPK